MRKFGRLEAWKLGFLRLKPLAPRSHPSPRRGVPFSGDSPFVFLRVPSWFFVILRVSPAGQIFHSSPTTPPVARLPRVPFSVSVLQGGASRPQYAILTGQKG